MLSRARHKLTLASACALAASTIAITATSTVSPAASSDQEAAIELVAGGRYFNFQPGSVATPNDWIGDTGAPFSAARGWGWVAGTGTKTPISMADRMVKRGTNPIYDTFVETGPATRGGSAAGRWEINLPNGPYTVTVGVGDNDDINRVHRVAVEGTLIVDGFVPRVGDGRTRETAVIQLTDGTLSVNPWGGYRTTITFIAIVPGDRLPTTTTLPATTTTRGVTTTTRAATTTTRAATTTTRAATTTTRGATTTTRAPGGGAGTFGSKVGFGGEGGWAGMTPDELRRELDAMQALGAKWLRLEANWHATEPVKGTFRTERTAFIAREALNRGIKPVILLSYTPPWARISACAHTLVCEPANVNDFANYAKHVAQALKPIGVHHYEIWNEPNILVFWAPKPNPTKYAALLKATYSALKAVDPASIVISGGVAPGADTTSGKTISPKTFITSLYNNGAKNSFDGIGTHPYSQPAMPMDPFQWNAFYVQPQIRDLMVAKGDGHKKIWFTEFGFATGNWRTTHAWSFTPAQQSEGLLEAVTQTGRWSWVGALLIFNYRDAGWDPTIREDNFGLVRPDFTPKPVVAPMKVLLHSRI